MGDLPRHFDSPEEAYFGFFRADKAKDGEAWAAANSYPHVRITPTTKLVGMDAKSTSFFVETPEEYAAEADWTEREATGWVGTKGRQPVRFHESPDKVHLLGGWTRYNKDDEPIRSNRVTYIMTKVDGSWGIQARFSVQSFDSPDDEVGKKCEALVEGYIEAMKAGDDAKQISLSRYPFVIVGVGEVTVINDVQEMYDLFNKTPARNVTASIVQALQTSDSGALVSAAVAFDTGERENHLLLVGKLDDSWTIAGVSSMIDMVE
jgi:hypothetical protein